MYIKKQTVLITGGAMGMGKLFAAKCLARGAKNIVLWDINEAELNRTTRELSLKGYENVFPYIVDISKPDEVQRTAADVLASVGTVDILFNNAGIVIGKPFSEHTTNDITRTLDINIGGVMHTTAAFLPAMMTKNVGHIVNIASAAGYLSNPNMSVYAASKWAVLGWSESLRLELEDTHPNVRVLTVTPSYINTGMFDGVKAPLLTPILEPDFITTRILDAVERNEILLRAPFIVNVLPALKGVMPVRAFDFLADKVFGVYSSMDKFKGHNAKT